MIFEEYQLRLDHYFLDTQSKERNPIEDPLVIRASFDRNFGRSPIVLNELLDRMKQEVLVRTKIGEDWYKDEVKE